MNPPLPPAPPPNGERVETGPPPEDLAVEMGEPRRMLLQCSHRFPDGSSAWVEPGEEGQRG